MSSLIGTIIEKGYQHYDTLDLFYSSYQVGAEENPYHLSTFEKTKIFFKAFECMLFLRTARELLKPVSQTFRLADDDLINDLFFLIVGLGSLYFGASRLVKKINSVYHPKEWIIDDPDIESSLNAKYRWRRPDSESTRQMLRVARGLVNIQLFTFFPSNPLYAANAALQIYSFTKQAQKKWINIYQTNEIVFVDNEDVEKKTNASITFNYYFLVQKTLDGLGEPCSICHELDPDVLFDARHYYHKDCILSWIDTKVSNFLSKYFKAQIGPPSYSCYNLPGIRIFSSVTCSLKMPADSIPSCPMCRVTGRINHYDAEVIHPRYGQHAVDIILKIK